MRIKAIVTEPETAIKIFEKHNALGKEIYQAMKDGAPQFRRVGGNQYVAVGLAQNRHLTIFFRYDEKTKEAEITTAYPSDKKQIRWYKKVKP